MRKAYVYVHGIAAGILEELGSQQYRFTYYSGYHGEPVSLTMPVANLIYNYNQFPSFFEGLLPEGRMLEALLNKYKLDKKDYLSQLLQVGGDTVGAVTIKEML